MLQGPVFEAVVTCTAIYLHEPYAVLSGHHLNSAPTELAIDLRELARQLGVDAESPFWTPQVLPELLGYLPSGVSLSLFGRGPNWLIAAAAIHAQPKRFYQFDPRLGWVTPVQVLPGAPAAGGWLEVQVTQCEAYQLLEITLPGHYVDYAECAQTFAPAVNAAQGLVLSGKVPHWLMAGMAIAYCNQPWLAVYQPTLGYAVVIASRTRGVPIGDLVPVDHTLLGSTHTRPGAAEPSPQ